jgi:hypothetical protein
MHWCKEKGWIQYNRAKYIVLTHFIYTKKSDKRLIAEERSDNYCQTVVNRILYQNGTHKVPEN